MKDMVSTPGPSSDWAKNAACRNHPTVSWFPQDAGMARAAREICRQCTVRVECLEYALGMRIDAGVWGGTTPGERLRIAARRQMERKAAQAS